MAKALMESLQIDLPALAQIIRAKGRGKDSVLAHITPKEAALLKKRGGSGTINPDTGLPEFEDSFDYAPVETAAPVSPVYDVVQGTGAEQTFTPTFTETKGAAAGTELPVGPAYTPGAVPTDISQLDIGFGPGRYTPPTTAAEIAGRTFTPAEAAMYGYTQPGVVTPPQQAPAPTAPTKTEQEKILGMSPDTLARLGLATGLGLYGTTQARKGGQQIQAATQEQKQLATPYKTQGQELVRAAQAGELTPASQQSYRAAQAQLAQQIANRGGVGAEQAANQLEALRQNLLQNQYNYGLQVSQIGDNIALGAIRTGMQLDTQLNAASNSFYTSLASIAAGIPMVRA